MSLNKLLGTNEEHYFLLEHLDTLFAVEEMWKEGDESVLKKLQHIMVADVSTVFKKECFSVDSVSPEARPSGSENPFRDTGGYWEGDHFRVISVAGKNLPLLAITFKEEAIFQNSLCAVIDMTAAYWQAKKLSEPTAEHLKGLAQSALRDGDGPDWRSKGAKNENYFVGAWTPPGEITLDYGDCANNATELKRALKTVIRQYKEVLRIWDPHYKGGSML